MLWLAISLPLTVLLCTSRHCIIIISHSMLTKSNLQISPKMNDVLEEASSFKRTDSGVILRSSKSTSKKHATGHTRSTSAPHTPLFTPTSKDGGMNWADEMDLWDERREDSYRRKVPFLSCATSLAPPFFCQF